jgi:hypothetical protein
MNNSDIQPSIWYYGLAILIIIVGFIAFAGFIFTSVSDMGESLMQVEVPGSADLDLEEPGEYTIFYENQTYFNGKFYSTDEQIPSLQINVSEIATGSYLKTYPSPGSFTYDFGSRSGRAITSFKVDRPGNYRINASYSEGPGPDVVLAVGKGIVEGIFSSILTSLAALLGSIAVAAIISFVTYTRRKKALTQKNEEERLMRGAT